MWGPRKVRLTGGREPRNLRKLFCHLDSPCRTGTDVKVGTHLLLALFLAKLDASDLSLSSSPPTTAQPSQFAPSTLFPPFFPPENALNAPTMIPTATGRIRRGPRPRSLGPLVLVLALLLMLMLFGTAVEASVGDRLPEFRECVEVRDTTLRARKGVAIEGDEKIDTDCNKGLISVVRAGVQAGEL